MYLSQAGCWAGIAGADRHIRHVFFSAPGTTPHRRTLPAMNADITRILSILAQTAPQQPSHPRPPDPRLPHIHHAPQYPPDPAPAVAPAVDPATIADWPTALKYVMNTLGKDEAVMAQIKKVRPLPLPRRTRGWGVDSSCR